ncbi:MAG: magnesium transporter [Pseudomonadota bacterium]|nr:magnesium transporter [Pseudomonadota bacterium]
MVRDQAAALGSNAGTQALMVAVRAIATKELTVNNGTRTIGEEILFGGINGILLPAILFFIVGLWFSDLSLGVVFGLAIIINMVVAGLIGVGVPVALYRGGIGPALASCVLVTAITDIIGFFAS